MKIYISGPIAGKPDKNKRAFADAAMWLAAEAGPRSGVLVQPVNPHDIPPREHEGECPNSYYHDGTHSSACYLRTDLIALLDCDAMLMLEGWVTSKGASVEIYVAKQAGIPIFYSRADFAMHCKEKAAVKK